MKKLGIFCAGLALVLAAPVAMAANIVADPGFEGGTPNAAWTEASTNFGTPLCDLGSCGTGGGTGPGAGDWWAWFGGVGGAPETGSVSQSLTIPVGANTLEFLLENPASDSTDDFVEARIDGVGVFTYFADGSIPLYALQTVDISAFADGAVHTLEFYSETISTNGLPSNFFIDEVNIDDGVAPVGTGACCAADTCTIGTEADCIAAGGAYQGDDTECVTNSGVEADYVDTPGTPIPDSGGGPVSTDIVVPDSFGIADLDVDFITDHTWTGDLVMTVTSPAGTVVTIADRDLCGSESTADVIFDDEAAGIVCGGFGLPATGSGPGTEALSAFDGEDSAGTWTLTVEDNAGGDTGSIVQWSLHFDIGESVCTGDGACCTDDAGVASSCIETDQASCEADGGLFVGGSCADVVDCLPLFVEFDSIAAVQTPHGVAVRWVTSLESETVGFQVYSKEGRGKKGLVPVGRFIRSAGYGTAGASYEVLDRGAKASDGKVYFVEDTDQNGRKTLHGPFEVTGQRVRPSGRTR